MQVTTLDHIHVYADDPNRSVQFYCDVFGAEHLGKLPGTDNQGILIGGQLIIIGPFPEGMNAKPPPTHGDGAFTTGYGVAHVGLQTDDLGALTKRAKQAGAEVHAPPRTSKTVDFVYLTAPDGVIVELTQLRLSGKLRSLKPVFDGYNRLVHLSKRAFLSQVFEPS